MVEGEMGVYFFEWGYNKEIKTVEGENDLELVN